MVIVFNSARKILQPYTPDRACCAGRRRTSSRRSAPRASRRRSPWPTASPTRCDRPTTAVAPDRRRSRPRRAPTSPPEGIAAEVHLFSDGRFPDVPAFAAGNLTMNYHRIGKPGPRRTTSASSPSTPPATSRTPAKLQVFVRVLNFRRQEVEVQGRAGECASRSRPISNSTTRADDRQASRPQLWPPTRTTTSRRRTGPARASSPSS